LLAHGQRFSPGTPASSTTKTGCHDIAEILLKEHYGREYLHSIYIITLFTESPQINPFKMCLLISNENVIPVL
jgi:hypothetical protein